MDPRRQAADCDGKRERIARQQQRDRPAEGGEQKRAHVDEGWDDLAIEQDQDRQHEEYPRNDRDREVAQHLGLPFGTPEHQPGDPGG